MTITKLVEAMAAAGYQYRTAAARYEWARHPTTEDPDGSYQAECLMALDAARERYRAAVLDWIAAVRGV